MTVYGVNAVREALRAGRVERLTVSATGNPRVQELASLAAERGIPIDTADVRVLDRAARGGVHQGIVASVRGVEAWTPAELARQSDGPALIVVLDGVEDPHNLGAILRTADAVGASGLVRQARHAAPLDGIVARTSAGAVSHVRIATVVNIARAVEELKAEGVWTVGLDEAGAQPYDAVDFTAPTAVVLGAEGTGLRRLVKERCDFTASIPMAGRVSSLNVSVAAGVVLFEAARQRRR